MSFSHSDPHLYHGKTRYNLLKIATLTLSAQTPPASPSPSPSSSPSSQWWLCSPCHQLRALSSSQRLLGRTIWNFQTDFQTLLFPIQSLTDFNFDNVDQGEYCILHQGIRRTELVGNMESVHPLCQMGICRWSHFFFLTFTHGAALTLKFKSSFWIFHLHSRMHQNLIGTAASTSVKRSSNLYLQCEPKV